MFDVFISGIFASPVYITSWIVIMVFSVCLHELGHAVAAHYEGDDTAKNLGYFTLNPMKHMGPVSLIVLFLFGICWGACPVTPRNFRRRYSDAIVSFAGPAVNLVLAISFIIFTFVLESAFPEQLLAEGSALSIIEQFFWVGAYANSGLFLFNMLPVAPLDGHSIVISFFPRTMLFYSKLGNGGFIILWLFFSFFGFWTYARGMAQGMLDFLRLMA